MYRYRRAALVELCVSMLALASVAPVRAQSLADVARKEEERRKRVSQSGRVYTNKDLHPAPTAAPPPAAAEPKSDQKRVPEKDADNSATADSTSQDAKAPVGAANEPLKDREYWSGRLKALQEQVERDETYAAALQSRINALTADFVNRDDPAQRSVIERDRLRAIAESDRLKQAIPNDKKAIDTLLEEARRAGVPPGWLR